MKHFEIVKFLVFLLKYLGTVGFPAPRNVPRPPTEEVTVNIDKGRGTSPDTAGDDKDPQTLCFRDAIVCCTTSPPGAVVVSVSSLVLGTISVVPGTVGSLYSVANRILRLVLSGT